MAPLWFSKDEAVEQVSQGFGGAYGLPVFYGLKKVLGAAERGC